MTASDEIGIIDALQCGHFDRAVLEQLLRGRFLCVTPTLGFWGDALEGMDAIASWFDLQRANGDLMAIALTTGDIRAAAAEGKIAVLLGFQNTSHFNGRIRFVEIFAKLGIRVTQLTYNIQNDVGSSCYEPIDTGLSRFGREVVREMNLRGILIDCSHAGDRTTLDAIAASDKPVAITHANASRLMPHMRNKNDQVLKSLAQNGGVIGCATYRNITPESACGSIDAWAEMVARTVDIVGIDHVGFGTDEGHNVGQPELDWMRYGRWTRSEQYGAGSKANAGPPAPLEWLPEVYGMAAVPDALARVGFTPPEIRKISSENWLRVYSENFG